ncbi:hypothetical protein NL438_26205, partial [Klebsiella pneumoniae]|nr:hypothetical protein [Klebsiella pneumoniae]
MQGLERKGTNLNGHMLMKICLQPQFMTLFEIKGARLRHDVFWKEKKSNSLFVHFFQTIAKFLKNSFGGAVGPCSTMKG